MHHADVVELVDTLDSGSSACKGMKVQVLSSALKDPVVRYRVFRLSNKLDFCLSNLQRNIEMADKR